MAKRSQRSIDAERKFRERLAIIGASPIYIEWQGINNPHAVTCEKGHQWFPRPNNLRRGHGCRACTGHDPVEAERRFKGNLNKIGAEPLYKKWQGSVNGHKVRCINGHICYPAPANLSRGVGICTVCVDSDWRKAEIAFRKNLALLGAKPAYYKYEGKDKPHKVICSAGHECFPRPGNVRRGVGICAPCANKVWDTFYVTVNYGLGTIKFGITLGNSKRRISDHARAGYTVVERLLGNLPDNIARNIEKVCLSTLRDAGWTPVRGREYFDIGALPTVLDIVDNYPIPGR
jgi:hypothetical protein